MKYIIISNYFPPELGAAANRIYNLSRALLGTSNVSVICPLPNYPTGAIFKDYKYKIIKSETRDEIKVYRYFIYPTTSKNFLLRGFGMLSFSLSIWLILFRWKLLKSADLIIVQNSPLLVSFSSIILFKKIFKKKLVLNVSDIWPDSAKTLGAIRSNSKMYKLLKKIEIFNYTNSTAIVGQSNEIINHLSNYVNCPTFLYRNLQPLINVNSYTQFPDMRIVYAGLLGVAQGLLEIISNVNFDKFNIKFDIYGDGNEKDQIVEFIELNKIQNVSYKGILPKSELDLILPRYHFALVPLKKYIYGAIPSKIYELASYGVPMIYMGEGEAASLVTDNHLGYTIKPQDFKSLEKVLQVIVKMDPSSYERLKKSCFKASAGKFSFEKQITSFRNFINNEI